MKKLFASLAVVLLGAPSASAQELHPFVGPSDATLDGGQGYFSYHQACQSTFPGSVWCTEKMIIEGGPAEGVVLDPLDRLWVNPVPVGGLTDGNDFRAVTYSFRFDNVSLSNVLTCSRWTDGTVGVSGLVLEGSAISGVNGTFVNRSCNNDIPAACCRGVKPPKDKNQ